MAQPIDFAEDWKATRYDDLEAVTVESVDPDGADGADVLATAAGVTALAGRETEGEVAGGDGSVVVKKRNFTLVAGEVAGFAVKSRDRIVRADGSVYVAGEVQTGGFGALVVCPDCVKRKGV